MAGAGGFRTRITVQLPKNERRRFDPEDWNTTTSIHPAALHSEIAIVHEMVKFCCEYGGQTLVKLYQFVVSDFLPNWLALPQELCDTKEEAEHLAATLALMKLSQA